MRVWPWLLVAACGTDVRTTPEDAATTTPDGVGSGFRFDGGVFHDAVSPPPDGIPPGLTPCEEAVYHSDFEFIQRAVFDVTCTTRCHGDTPPASMMSLKSGEAYASLVDV